MAKTFHYFCYNYFF